MHRDYSTPTQRIESETAKTQGLSTRRRFLAVASVGIGHAALGGRAIAESSKPLKVKDVVEHFLSYAQVQKRCDFHGGRAGGFIRCGGYRDQQHQER